MCFVQVDLEKNDIIFFKIKELYMLVWAMCDWSLLGKLTEERGAYGIHIHYLSIETGVLIIIIFFFFFGSRNKY